MKFKYLPIVMFWAEIELGVVRTCKDELTPVLDFVEISVTFSVNMKTLKFNKINNKVKQISKHAAMSLFCIVAWSWSKSSQLKKNSKNEVLNRHPINIK